MSPSTRGSTSRTSALTKLSVMSPCGGGAAACAGVDPTITTLPEMICVRGVGTTGLGLATSGSLTPCGVKRWGEVDEAAAVADEVGVCADWSWVQEQIPM